MGLSTADRKERLRRRAAVFLRHVPSDNPDEALDSLVDLLDDFRIDAEDLYSVKVDRSEIREILTLMREKFEAVDQRFEAVDKRFEDLQRSMDRRFEDMQKSMDRRFTMLQWFIGIGFSLLAVMMTLYRFFAP